MWTYFKGCSQHFCFINELRGIQASRRAWDDGDKQLAYV